MVNIFVKAFINLQQELRARNFPRIIHSMLQFFFELTLLEQIVYISLILTLLYQLGVWLGYGLIAKYRHHSNAKSGEPKPAVSIVVVVTEGQEWYVARELEKLLTQRYDAEWEVVVVNDWGGLSVTTELEDLALRYPNLRFTELKKDPKFPHSRKIPLFLGIKAAKYPNIIIADPTASPRSDRWLSLMARGFNGAEVVIGYTGFSPKANFLIRSSRLNSSIRYLSAAVADRPYRGIYNNIGYTKKLFFGLKGFTHLRLATGEDDLFIQKATKFVEANVMINPLCTMEQSVYRGLGWWWNEQRYRSYSFKFYPLSVRFRVFMELLTKAIFIASVVLATLSSLLWGGWMWGWIVAASAFTLRELTLWWSLRRVVRRLGEKSIIAGYMLYDLINPLTEALLSISRRVRENRELWK